ncbi:hypothetical protein ACIPVK_12265 [Paeniglutamicibacter sp. MACA_103]|uniref:hypothetical protein n=1 Tax=Paeniglutamicibacter sp. MACA_103 TaxID=3377337 RepID=UPI0038959AA3
MLPWWFWLLLWVVLALGTLLFLVLAGIRLFRGFMALAGDVGEAMDRVGASMDADPEPRTYPEIPDRTPSGIAALFQDPDDARAAHDAGKLRRSAARRNARIERKTRRGQAQRVSDLELF